MSVTTKLVAEERKFSFQSGRIRSILMRHPEWRGWFFSLFAWAFLILSQFNSSHEVRHLSGRIIYCLPQETVQAAGQPTYETGSLTSRILTTISNGLLPWIIMMVAMMFPLLNKPIRHVAFSVRRKDRDFGILGFLVGYSLIWLLVGVLFLLLPFFLDMVVGDQTDLTNSLINSSGFLLAAALIWLPGRPIRMMKCDQTIPIRIQTRQLYLDSLSYGFKIGFACLNVCWAPMAAIMLVHHNAILMCVVTFILIYERYLLPHTSKLSGYAWGVIALTLFAFEMWT